MISLPPPMHSISIQNETDRLLSHIKDGIPMTFSQRLSLTLRLSFPAILAQLSSIVMQYIDAAMVGSLGAEASASIGLVASTTWLFSGLCSAVVAGFAVQVAHLLGAGENKSARSVLRQSIKHSFLPGVAFAFVESVNLCMSKMCALYKTCKTPCDFSPNVL